MKNLKFDAEIKRAGLSDAKLIWAPTGSDAEEYCFFRKTVMCDKLPKSAILNIFVQSQYKLYINGEEVVASDAGAGECAKTDEIDVLTYLRQGKNVIAIFAHYIPYPITKIALRQKGVIFDLKLNYTGARNESIISDSSVLCAPCDAYMKNAPKLSKEKTACEVFDNGAFDSDWTQVDYDDIDWECAVQTNLSETEYFDIEKSEFKCPVKHIHSAKAIIAAGTGDDIKGIDLAGTLYGNLPRCVLNKLYVVGTECEIQPMDKGQHSYILVDFDRVCSGYIKLDINGYGSDTVDVIFAKELSDGVPVVSGAARFILKAENNILETNFDKNEFRYVLLVFRNPVRTNVVNGIWAIDSEYPFENTSAFSSNDESLNEVFEKGARCVKAKFSKNISYIAPDEKNTIFSQRVAAVSNCYLTGETHHYKELIKDFMSMQTQKGSIVNKKAPELSFDFYDLLASVLSVKDYIGLCGDEKLPENICEKFIALFRYISEYEAEGLLKDVPARFKSDALLNLYYIYALENMSEICSAFGCRQGVKFYDGKASKLKKLFKEEYMQDEQLFWTENKNYEGDLKALMTLVFDVPMTEEAGGKINMPLEFVRALRKSGNNQLLVDLLTNEKISSDVWVTAIAENIIGIDLTGKKGIKCSADTVNFENIEAEMYTPKGVVSVSVKNKVVEKNTLSVNINQADGEL